jgi:iron(III) transport system substrate-binding protein
MNWLRIFGFTAALLPVVAQAQTQAEWAKVIEGAKKEGKVVVYSGYVSPDTHNAINAAFRKKYGLQVDVLTARGGELRERVRMEQQTGRFLADVYHMAISITSLSFGKDNTLQAHGGLPNIANLTPGMAARANQWMAPIFTINYGLLYNSQMLKPEDAPKSWSDLLDPKWRGKIMMDDPRASGGGRVFFHMTYDKFGRGFHEKLAQQQPTFVRDYNEAARRVARGEYPIYLPFIFGAFEKLKALPIKYVLMEEGATYGSYGVSVMTNAPNPNAARLLANFYLGEEAQAIYAKTGHGIVINNLKEKLSPEMEALAKVKPLIEEDFTRIDEHFKNAKEIYK